MVNKLCLAALVAALLLIGCGGGGGGGGGGNGGGNGGGGGNYAGIEPGQYLEFISNTRAGSELDPFNLQPGDDIQVTVANYDGQNRTVLSGRNFAVAGVDPSTVSISSTGRLRVLKPTSAIFTVSADATVAGQSKTYDQQASLTRYNTFVSGIVRSESTGVGMQKVNVLFYDQSGALVAGSRTTTGGAFRASVPMSVQRVSIDSSSIPVPKYYKSYIYGGKVYVMDAQDCRAKVGTLVAGQVNTLPSALSVYQQSDGPPPPPDGCGG